MIREYIEEQEGEQIADERLTNLFAVRHLSTNATEVG
jgi:hypothetical protein